jgi:hypothetical protein
MPNIPRFIPWIRRQVRPELPTCSICNEPVELETTRSNENGKAIHEECYVLKVHLKQATTPPERLTVGSGCSLNFHKLAIGSACGKLWP